MSSIAGKNHTWCDTVVRGVCPSPRGNTAVVRANVNLCLVYLDTASLDLNFINSVCDVGHGRDVVVFFARYVWVQFSIFNSSAV